MDNNFLENSETFSINITSYKLLHGSLYFDYNPTIDLRAGSIEVTIEDDDCKCWNSEIIRSESVIFL